MVDEQRRAAGAPAQTSRSLRNVALIGAGRMGRAHALAAAGLGLSLGAVCDRRPDAAAALGEEFKVPEGRRFTSAEDMFAAIDAPDLVLIATTTDTHHSLVCLAAKAQARAILCEKPMARSIAQCRDMIEACRRSGARLAINHQMRFMPQYRLVRSVLDEGKIGRLASMNVVAGCFGLAMNGSHYIEAFHFLTGSWPVEVSARFTGAPFVNPRGPQFFDQAGDVRFVTDSGQRLVLSIGHDQGHGMTAMYAGAFGHIFVDELEGEAIVTSRLPEHRTIPATRYGMPWERVTSRFMPADNVEPTKAVMAALLAGANYPDGESGLHIVSAIAGAYASAENGSRPIRLKDNEGEEDRVFQWA